MTGFEVFCVSCSEICFKLVVVLFADVRITSLDMCMCVKNV